MNELDESQISIILYTFDIIYVYAMGGDFYEFR